jgi:hypothetical protein
MTRAPYGGRMDRMIFRQSYGTERKRMIIAYGHTHAFFEKPSYKA